MDNLEKLEQQTEAAVKSWGIGKIITIIGMILLLVWLVWLWYGNQPVVPKDWAQAAPAHQVGGMPKVDHPAPSKVKVLPKKQAGKKLQLSSDIQDDDNQQIIDTAEIPPAPDGATTTTIMDMQTGQSKTLFKANPRPLFAFLRSGSAGVRYGITTSGQQQAQLFVRQDVLRVGNVYLAAAIEARGTTVAKPESFAGLEVSYRW